MPLYPSMHCVTHSHAISMPFSHWWDRKGGKHRKASTLNYNVYIYIDIYIYRVSAMGVYIYVCDYICNIL